MPIEVRANPLEGRHALSLCAVVRNEMYFLPEFLRHYRGLGVSRFIFLDDGSGDGTAEFLAGEPDCMLLGSRYRFSDRINGKAAIFTWRQAMLDRFCRDQWTIVADADEFLAPPEGVAMPEVIARLEAAGSASVWGAMVDLYPPRVEAPPAFTLAREWYFDARPLLWVRPGWRKPVPLYRGCRARLLADNRVSIPSKGPLHRAALSLGLGAFIKVNNLTKVPLVRWSARHRIDGQHRVTPPPATADILAVMHFKFAGDLKSKFADAREIRNYPDRAQHYHLMSELLTKMRENGRGFLGPSSRRLTSPDDFYAARVGRWTARG